jgi:hypothetical protein
MTEAELTHYASWASIASLFMSIISLLYVRSIKSNIIKFRRKQRIRQLLESTLFISKYHLSASRELAEKFVALQRNLPIRAWSRFTPRGRITIELHRHIEDGDIAAVREVIYDWLSYSEDI